MDKEYYLRDLSIEDWEKFQEMELEIFPEEPTTRKSFINGLPSLKTSSVVMVNKETKKFIGYYRIAIYGNTGHIYRVGVLPAERRKGYGSILLEKSLYYLEKAGCEKYYLYVIMDNEPAIKMYEKYGFEIETKSLQFEIPYQNLSLQPRGRCRHIDWGEIQLISLRFGVNPFQIQQYFAQEGQHLLTYEILGQQIGFCRFSPDFPGAMPFILRDSQYIYDFVGLLKEYITNQEFNAIKITFDGQEHLVKKMTNDKIPIRYSLLKMIKIKNKEEKSHL